MSYVHKRSHVKLVEAGVLVEHKAVLEQVGWQGLRAADKPLKLLNLLFVFRYNLVISG